MKLRATYRAPDASRYRAVGGAWDVPVLDSVMRQRPPGAGAVLVDGDLRFDGPQLETLVAGLAGGLRSMGVRRGDVVTWQMPNWWEALVLYRACWRCGAVAAPLHHQFGAAEVNYMVELLEPTVAFSSSVLPLAEREGTICVRSDESRFDELLAASPVRATTRRRQLPPARAPITPPIWPWSSSPRDRRGGPRPCCIRTGAWPTRRAR